MVSKFLALILAIEDLPDLVPSTMVQLDCKGLKDGLVSQAKHYTKMILEKVATDHRKDNRQSVLSRNALR